MSTPRDVVSKTSRLMHVLLEYTLLSTLVLLFSGSLFFIPSFAADPVFSAPINISHDSGVARFPNVANSGDHVYVAWTEGGRGIFFRASMNDGVTWSPPVSSQAKKI